MGKDRVSVPVYLSREEIKILRDLVTNSSLDVTTKHALISPLAHGLLHFGSPLYENRVRGIDSEQLTLDQLKEMRGKPIWFVSTACDGEALERYDIITKITEYSMETALGENVPLENYGKTWSAYPSRR